MSFVLAVAILANLSPLAGAFTPKTFGVRSVAELQKVRDREMGRRNEFFAPNRWEGAPSKDRI